MTRLYDVLPARELLEKIGPSAFLYEEDYDLGKIYRNELKSVTTVRMFKNHIFRWKNFYLLMENSELEDSRRFCLKRFNTSRLFNKWRKIDRGTNSNYLGSGEYASMAYEITFPVAIMESFLIQEKYGVSINVAFVQRFNDRGGEFF